MSQTFTAMSSSTRDNSESRSSKVAGSTNWAPRRQHGAATTRACRKFPTPGTMTWPRRSGTLTPSCAPGQHKAQKEDQPCDHS